MNIRWSCVAVVAVVGLGVVSCGGSGSSSKGGSFSNITASIAEPSGTVDETSAAGVAEEFETASSASSASPFGRREEILRATSSQTITIDCPAGGDISMIASGSGTSGTAKGTYNSCCVEASCCFDGTVNSYVSGDASGEVIQVCVEASITGTCQGESAAAEYSGCIGANGEMVILVEVNGESFAVSGNYSNGNGTLEIKGDNGSFTCTYSGGTGSCTGSGGDFSF